MIEVIGVALGAAVTRANGLGVREVWGNGREEEESGPWQSCCGQDGEGGSDTRFGPLQHYKNGTSAPKRPDRRIVEKQIQAVLQSGQGPTDSILWMLDTQGSFGVWIKSLHGTYAKRHPDARLLTAFLDPCASAYLWTFLTAMLQILRILSITT